MEEIKEQDFDEVYSLLKMSFIKDELRPYDEQKALLKEPIYHIYAEREDNNKQLKAFIAIWNFTDFVFVDYFAVHPSYRNQGLGKKMLHALSEMTEKEICLEIETPRNEMTIRRLNFYERNKFLLCDFKYVQPPIAKGNAPVSLSLMSNRVIHEKERFEKIKTEIYKFAYKRFN